MNLQQRKALLLRLGNYMSGNDYAWISAKEKATTNNPWFTHEFVDLAVRNIIENFLQPDQLQAVEEHYQIPNENVISKNVGIVMAGNIPLVGFHDMFCVFITGHKARIKPSSKDAVLMSHLVEVLSHWDDSISGYLSICERIPDCDAYIATGSNQSARYFDYYFKKYPNLIRKNRTSIAVLTGEETSQDLEKLSDDVFQFFGLGCRNVTKIYVPENYDFIPLLQTFKKYDYLSDHNKYKNNYDYNLAVHILNNQYYMSTCSIILVREESFFSRISQLNYSFYTAEADLLTKLRMNDQIQCIVGSNNVPFGKAQTPGIFEFADGIDPIKFLLSL